MCTLISVVTLFLSAVVQKAVNTKMAAMAASYQVIIGDCSQVTSIWKADLDKENVSFDVF